jgi:hypothetical protein
MYREMLLEQMEKVERGEDPMEVYRDPAKNQFIGFALEHADQPQPSAPSGPGQEMMQNQAVRNMDAVKYVQARYYPTGDQLKAARREARERVAAGGQLLPPIAPPSQDAEAESHREGLIMPGTFEGSR